MELKQAPNSLSRQYCTGIMYLTNYYFIGEASDSLISVGNATVYQGY